MKDYLILLSQYNSAANSTIFNLFSSLNKSDLLLDKGSFAKSLYGLMDHIAEGEIYFQKQIRNAFPKLKFLNHKYIDWETEYGKINFPDLNQLHDVISTCDNGFIDASRTLNEKDFERKIKVDSFEGELQQKVAFLYLQAINHSTHHRGQISQILDEMKIEHDFSGIRESF